MGHLTRVLLSAASAAALLAPGASAQTVPGYADARDVEPVVLKGVDLGAWATPTNQTARLPLVDTFCWTGGDGSVPDPTTGGGAELGELGDNSQCPHSHYAEPDADTADVLAPEGTAVDRLLAYKWSATLRKHVQIPFQVDEVFTRYL